MIDLFNDSVWIKANDLIKEKYGKSLSYRAIKLMGEETDSKAQTGFYSNGDDLIIPLKLKNYNLGDVVVDRGSLLDVQQKSEVTDLIKFLVEPKLYNIQLKKSEEGLISRSSRTLSLVQSDEAVVELHHDEADAKKQTLSQIILLKSNVELSRHRVAMKIHEMTERNLFVHFDDIIKSISTKEDLASLTDVSIYINDVQALSLESMQLIKEHLDGNCANGPLFLVGSNLSMESILEQQWPDGFRQDLAGFHFDIDRVPLAQQTSEEVLELLFFQIDSLLT
jgi:hypothetical protein